MKGQKRIVTAVLAAFMLLSLAACDSGAAKNSQAPSAPPAESGAPEKSAAPEVQWPPVRWPRSSTKSCQPT